MNTQGLCPSRQREGPTVSLFPYLGSCGTSQPQLPTLLPSSLPFPPLPCRPASPMACSLYTQDLALSLPEDSRSSLWSVWLTLWGGVKSFWPSISLTETLEKILLAFLTLSLLKHVCQVLRLGLDNTPKRLALLPALPVQENPSRDVQQSRLGCFL